MRRLIAIIGGIVVAFLCLAVGGRQIARSRTFQFFSRPVDHVTTTDSVVALTFDDGPTTARVDSLLEMLSARRVKATFFLIGSQITAAPAAARALVAAGHEIGNHTYTHDHMIFRTTGAYRAQITRTDSLLRAAGARDPIFFRPPYCYKLIGLPYVLWRMGRTTVTWDIEPESFPAVAGTSDGIVRHVLSRVRPGSIILLHPWYPAGATTRAAIPVLIDSLRARGYSIETVSGLLAHEKRRNR
jgi:peptidoglycan/xylan/chitin deacetylase (PgdA/CDA1 family)